MDRSQKVVITGTGAISSIGKTVEENWQNVLNGVSGVGPVTLFDVSNYLAQIACEVKNFRPEDYMPAKEARRRDRFEQFAAVAAAEAIAQSGILLERINPERVGVIVSSAIGGLGVLQENIPLIEKEGPRKVSPFAIPMLMGNGAAGMTAIDYGFTGPCFSVTSACASGADGIGTAWRLIMSGIIDAAICGGQ